MPDLRQNNLFRILAASSAIVTLAVGGVTGDYYLNPKIDLGAVKVTEYEYLTVKPALVQLVNQMTEENPLTIEQTQMWLKAADREVKLCGNVNLDPKQNLIPQINEILANGCP